MKYKNDRRAKQEAVIPAILLKVMFDAIEKSKSKAQTDKLEKIYNESLEKLYEIIRKPKLLLKVQKIVNEIMNLFVNKQDGTYHIRKVILTLHGVTQTALDLDYIENDVALLVQEALILENEIYIDDESWHKLKSSADKKVDQIIDIIANI